MKALRLTSLVVAFAVAGTSAGAQANPADRARVLAIADSALAAISRGDMIAFTDLMTEDATIMSVRSEDGNGRYSLRTRAAERARAQGRAITERGFQAQVQMSGPLAVVWLPYDLYIEGAWSHCGVDVFTMVKIAWLWKVTAATWTIEQPPACARHPDGPPRVSPP